MKNKSEHSFPNFCYVFHNKFNDKRTFYDQYALGVSSDENEGHASYYFSFVIYEDCCC